MHHDLELKILFYLQKCLYTQLKQIHAVIITTSLDRDPLVCLKFLRRSTEFGGMEYADLIYTQMGGFSNSGIAIWNAMMRGYAYNGPYVKALKLFDEMTRRGLEPNNFTYPYILSACCNMDLFVVGQKLHSRVIKSGFLVAFSVGAAFFEFYARKAGFLEEGVRKMGSLKEARMMFDEIRDKSVELWNKMIGNYAMFGDVSNAKQLFDEMPQKDVVTWNTMLSAYSRESDVASADDLFRRMPEKNVVTWTTLLGCYANAGDVEKARGLFEQMPDRNVVSWNSMMSIYNKKGDYQQALDLFNRMVIEGVRPDSFTFVTALTACSHLSDLQSGRWVHSMLWDWHKMVVVVGTALSEMYANCGEIDKAFVLFIKIGQKDVFSYNVMIKSLAIHGRAEDAIKLFHLMQSRGLKLNDHTFSSALFACSHGGLVEKGQEIFKDIERSLNSGPKAEHYCLIVDLLCRNNGTDEAESLVKAMDIEPDIAIWGALLHGCHGRGDVKLAKSIIRKAIQLQSDESGVHVLLANIHASMGQWNDARRARKQMEDGGIVKKTGRSYFIS